MDPLDDAKVRLLSEILGKRRAEIDRLKSRCYELGEGVKGVTDVERLMARVREHIQAKASKDLQDLLQIDRVALSNLLTKIASDEKSWVAVSAFLMGLTAGGNVLTAGAAIYGISKFGATAFKAAAERREKLRTNGYTLLYRMRTG